MVLLLVNLENYIRLKDNYFNYIDVYIVVMKMILNFNKRDWNIYIE